MSARETIKRIIAREYLIGGSECSLDRRIAALGARDLAALDRVADAIIAALQEQGEKADV